MNILIFEGSTRPNKGTQLHLNALIEKNPHCHFEQISLRDIKIPLFKDERVEGNWEYAKPLLPLLDKILEADLIILASPVYWFSVSNLMKNFLDFWTFFMRTEKTPDRYFLAGKKVITLLCASHKEGTEWAFGTLRCSIHYVKGEIVHEFLGLSDRDGTPLESTLKEIREYNL